MTFAVTRKGQEHIIDLSLNKLMEQLDPERFSVPTVRSLSVSMQSTMPSLFFNGKIVVTVRPPYKSKITISEEKLSAFKLWLNH